MLNIHANNLYVLGEQQNKIKRQQFLSNYNSQCMKKAIESLQATITTAAEHHYTLYYYDQAGNLVKTIPPKGVNPISNDATLSSIETDRDEGNVNPANNPVHTMATSYTYNSLNQLVSQITPDAGRTEFWYDELGRIIFSQNAKQRGSSDYSYTIYDELGRTKEVGEINVSNNVTLITSAVNHFISSSNFNILLNSGERTQVTRTYYDKAVQTTFNLNNNNYTFKQENLMKRVAVAAYYDNATYPDLDYKFASHFSYDIHGNVKSVLQDNPLMGIAHRYKLINYEYDLISGKVNKVIYQPKAADQFMHRYEYDADNRLTHVFTSRDGLIWEKEAKYWYYRHGPLARTEVGDLDVQGIDYAYTLQGWVKGINSNILEADKDLGRDNMDDAQNLHKNFGEDAASYSIGYFSGDFVAINPNYANFVAGIGSAGLATEAPDLYNGNINHMVTTIRNDAYAAQPQLTAYRYDQLNRIKQMRVQNAIINNSWTGSWIDRYKTLYDYDANGNIMSLTRYGGISPIEIIDQMHYQYSSNNNQLEYIKDQYPLIETPTTEPNFSGQSSGNYKYDLIGNMTEDVSGKIKEIKWNVYGKIESISRPDGNTTDDCLYFEYDATGNRVYKKSWRKDASNNDVQIKHTFYVRDAQGNILATYTKDGSNEIKLGEYNLYGSSRLGTASYNTTMSNLSWQNSGVYSRTLGLKRYEISNHLGNVLTVFSDKKHTLSNNHTTPYIVSTTDYDPFGMIMNGRNWNVGEYRFGFNGQEKDQEIYNNQSTTTATFWEYDGRIGRRWNLDPKPQISISDYACFGNNPISMVDPNGDRADKWNVNVESGKISHVDNTGGDKTQYVDYVDGNNKKIGETSVDGNNFSVSGTKSGDKTTVMIHGNDVKALKIFEYKKPFSLALSSEPKVSDATYSNPILHKKTELSSPLSRDGFDNASGVFGIYADFTGGNAGKFSNVLTIGVGLYDAWKEYDKGNTPVGVLAMTAINYSYGTPIFILQTCYNTEYMQKGIKNIYIDNYRENMRESEKGGFLSSMYYNRAQFYKKLYQSIK